MLVCKSSATRKDLHSYIISRFLESLGDLRTKQKGAAGGEVPFPSDFLTAVGKSPSPHLVMQLAAVEKKKPTLWPIWDHKFSVQKPNDRQKCFFPTRARISFKKLLLETYLKSTRQ